ncbi:10455_t:CDS:2, partial [Ambispora gerdemannii]
ESATVEEIKEESATVEEIKEESATVEEIKEESASVEEIKEESAAVEDTSAHSTTVEDDSIQSSANSESSLSPIPSPSLSPLNAEVADLQTQLAPLQLKTSHEFTHSIDPTTDFVEFNWKHGGTTVFVTGDFDEWRVTHKMQKDPVTGHFTVKVPIDVTKQYQFKFVVDGAWLLNRDWPTKRDEHNNENHVIYPSGPGPLNPEYKEYAVSQFNLTAAY